MLTVSDSLSGKESWIEKDKSGNIVEGKLGEAGFSSRREVCSDAKESISENFNELLRDSEVDAIITTGGTGVSPRDSTIEVIKPFFDKELSGFGELFRRQSYSQIGTSVILTRATAGVVNRNPVFCLPGSPDAVMTAVELITPELPHIIKHARE
ncbi:MAG: MogA/MoaB family molybdenum cofactor biosynthesis protein [Candidatus Hadarchaeota archaeon]